MSTALRMRQSAADQMNRSGTNGVSGDMYRDMSAGARRSGGSKPDVAACPLKRTRAMRTGRGPGCPLETLTTNVICNPHEIEIPSECQSSPTGDVKIQGESLPAIDRISGAKVMFLTS